MVSDHIFPTESTTCSKNLTLVPSTTFPPFRILRRISSYFSRVTNPGCHCLGGRGRQPLHQALAREAQFLRTPERIPDAGSVRLRQED